MNTILATDRFNEAGSDERNQEELVVDLDTCCGDNEFTGRELDFKPITLEAMDEIRPLLDYCKERTTDFSFGGILMWVDYFHYEYAVFEDTLFIKGRLEDDVRKTAFSHPIGKLSLETSVKLLKAYCRLNNEPLEFSAVPENYVEGYRKMSPRKITELTDWADYLYDATDLATLKGKRFSKKRNHVNQFEGSYPGWTLQKIGKDDIDRCLEFMKRFELEGDSTFMAKEERELTCRMLEHMRSENPNMIGVILDTGSGMCAFTIGDIVGDTLFVHVEKALREYPGSYEMINKAFAEYILLGHPEIEYINREDDAGDEGLRQAKESYRPIDRLKKYNIIF